ncbi:MAG: HEAT repeat domain-containing protein [Candidatus Wukongarchaeota archaeon]|nr:HEAT repeat domain-containing protein [Candidatus Wukongarchaeota archaeon]MDO8129684.1 HEAT repeat domain-containing protein [Candidatus Wukongarchaeota archaeon]
MPKLKNADKEYRILELIEDLDDDQDTRWEAARELDELGWEPRNDREKALYLIAKRQWDELVKLGEMGIKELIQDLKYEEYEETAETAIEALVEIGEPTIELLIEALKNENPEIREGAALSLGNIGDTRAKEP